MQQLVHRCGANIRRLRVARDLSLSELARRSGVAKGTLSRLEAGSGNPTIETLWLLAGALGVPFADLVTEADDEVLVVCGDREPDITLPEVRGAVIDRIFGRERTDVAEVIYAAGTVREAVPDVPGTITRIYVAAGDLTLDLPGRALDLHARDFVRFASDVPHRYTPHGGDVRLLHMINFGQTAWRQNGEDPLVVALNAARTRARRGG